MEVLHEYDEEHAQGEEQLSQETWMLPANPDVYRHIPTIYI